MDAIAKFKHECEDEIAVQGKDRELGRLTRTWMDCAAPHKYSYHFSWLGRPVIQYPQDILAMQELIWQVKPDLIIETGIAHGGSLIFYASMLELNALCGGPEHARALGIDIDIRRHNREALEEHPMLRRAAMFEGSSIAPDMVARVHNFAEKFSRVMLVLDSNHTHEHVLAELNAYAGLVTKGSYCVVFDTVVEYMPEDSFPDRAWGRGNNPMTAVQSFLEEHPEFEVDTGIDDKLLITAAPKGYLLRR